MVVSPSPPPGALSSLSNDPVLWYKVRSAVCQCWGLRILCAACSLPRPIGGSLRRETMKLTGKGAGTLRQARTSATRPLPPSLFPGPVLHFHKWW